MDASSATTNRIGINDNFCCKQGMLEIFDRLDPRLWVSRGDHDTNTCFGDCHLAPDLELPACRERRYGHGRRNDQVGFFPANNPLGDRTHRAVADDELVTRSPLEVTDNFLEYRLHRGGR